jgi:hypothetical protein
MFLFHLGLGPEFIIVMAIALIHVRVAFESYDLKRVSFLSLLCADEYFDALRGGAGTSSIDIAGVAGTSPADAHEATRRGMFVTYMVCISLGFYDGEH